MYHPYSIKPSTIALWRSFLFSTWSKASHCLDSSTSSIIRSPQDKRGITAHARFFVLCFHEVRRKEISLHKRGVICKTFPPKAPTVFFLSLFPPEDQNSASTSASAAISRSISCSVTIRGGANLRATLPAKFIKKPRSNILLTISVP